MSYSLLAITGPPRLLSRLKKFNRRTTIEKLSSLLTLPELHANTLRVELLIHLACLHCHGSKTPSRYELKHWLNVWLGATQAAQWEDAVEDTFIYNVMWETGNFRVFQGIWEGNGFNLQEILDATFLGYTPPESDELKRSVLGLLKLSEAIVSGPNFHRWTMGSGHPHQDIELPGDDELQRMVGNVSFSAEKLREIGIDPVVLNPFILPDISAGELATQELGRSSLESHPLISVDGYLVVCLPTAISVAIRFYVLRWLAARGLLHGLERKLRLKQSEYVFDELRIHAGLVVNQDHVFPPRTKGLPEFDQLLGRFDVDKVCHVIVLPESLEGVAREGLVAERNIPEFGESISAYIRVVADDLNRQYPGTKGLTLFIIGGLGRGFVFGLLEPPSDWVISAFSVDAITHFVRTSESNLLKLWKLKREEEAIEKSGITLFHPWGDLNLFACWREQGYTLIARDMEYPDQSMLSVAHNYVASLRENNHKDYDFHSVIFHNGAFRRTCRVTPHSYFGEARRLPVYCEVASLGEGILRGAVETAGRPWWLSMDSDPRSTSKHGRKFLYGLWNALLSWLDKLAPVLERYCPISLGPVHIEITVEQVDSWQELRGLTATNSSVLSHSVSGTTVVVRVPREFRSQFNKPENIAERTLLETVAREVLVIANGSAASEAPEITARAIVSEVMPSADMRMVHFFEARDPGAQLAGQGVISDPRFICPEDQTFCKLGMAARICPSVPKGIVSGVSACLKVLNAGVDRLWEEIATQLRGVNRLSLISMSLTNHESLLRDRSHWGETSRALMAIHSNSTDVQEVAHSREIDRIKAELANRILIEMSICEAPTIGGASATLELLDKLSAWIITLIELAQLSDAIKYGLVSPEFRIRNNGFIEGNQRSLAEVLDQYGKSTFREQFHQSAENYHAKYESRDSHAKIVEHHTAAFKNAFKSEYGMEVSEYYDVLAELWDCATEHLNTVVVLGLAELRARLRSNRSLSEESIDHFIAAFALHPRDSWDRVPPDFDKKDFYPWRYQRRLSLSMRPLVLVESSDPGTCIYGIQTVGQSMDYVLGRIENGWLDTESVRSDAMKSYIGVVANQEGEAFEAEVATYFPNDKWKTHQRLLLSSLGAPAELGDIDVLAWRQDGLGLIAIECKRLKPARTVGEIGEQLSKFKGEALDRLARHTKRLHWLNVNSESVRLHLGIPKSDFRFEGLLVTNVIVPMQYVKDLPIPPDRVVPLGKLADLVKRLSS
ncbi:MAG: hypothetical protein OJF52_001311 [Nitrospira sp.]|jgi:hypothetical protein|nr:hypothetical protein [Nitrospira sp.]WHZ14473.1 MAG: hypothetical protein OJF52_001311 [Nitrospira sp.]